MGIGGQTEIYQNRCDSCRLSLVYSEKLRLRIDSLR